MRSKNIVIGAVAAAFLAAGTAADAKTFRYSTSGDILGLDPFINNEGPTNTMKSNLYEGLIHRAWDLSLHPALATDWEQTSPTTWRFNLRKDVKFHNGNDFTADDVLISLDRIRLPASNMTFVVSSIDRIEKIDDHTIDIVTQYPDPTLLLNLPNFWVVYQFQNPGLIQLKPTGRRRGRITQCSEISSKYRALTHYEGVT